MGYPSKVAAHEDFSRRRAILRVPTATMRPPFGHPLTIQRVLKDPVVLGVGEGAQDEATKRCARRVRYGRHKLDFFGSKVLAELWKRDMARFR